VSGGEEMAVNNWIVANSIWITLAITILVLMYLVYAIIQTFRKKRGFVSQLNLNIILLILGLMFLIFLTYHANEIEGKDWGQIILMLGLVIVTALYASSTEKQADASVKMAEEMREQRIMTSQPIIVQKAVHEKDIWEGSTKDYFSHFEISNLGNSPAIELEISLLDNEKNCSQSIRQTYLRNDDLPIKFRPYNIENSDETKTYYLVSEYQNIFSYGLQKPLYQTRLPFTISKSSEEGKIYMIAGKLEFKEITDKERIDAFGSRSKPK
jgi:hypothetical protein